MTFKSKLRRVFWTWRFVIAQVVVGLGIVTRVANAVWPFPRLVALLAAITAVFASVIIYAEVKGARTAASPRLRTISTVATLVYIAATASIAFAAGWPSHLVMPFSGLAFAAFVLIGAYDRTLSAQEAQLAAREAALAETESIAQLGRWRWDVASDRLDFSSQLSRICGLPTDVPMTFSGLETYIHAEDRERIRHEVSRCVRGEDIQFEVRFVRGDGATRLLSVRSRPLVVHGRGTVLAGTAQDVTEKRELESRVVITDRLTSLGTIAGGVAHEVNNPLVSVLANVSLVRADLRAAAPASDEMRREWLEALDDAHAGAERVRHIIADMGTFSRGGPDEEGTGDVDAGLGLALKLTNHEVRDRARIVTDFVGVPPVRGSDSRLAQVFVNLLANAAQAIPPGRPGENVVRVATALAPDGRVVISISDTGVGMSDRVRARIFDPFFTTKPVGQGTGLGLSICHGIVSSVGGTIEVESAEGTGTTFRVYLAPAPAAARGTDPRRDQSENSLQSAAYVQSSSAG